MGNDHEHDSSYLVFQKIPVHGSSEIYCHLHTNLYLKKGRSKFLYLKNYHIHVDRKSSGEVSFETKLNEHFLNFLGRSYCEICSTKISYFTHIVKMVFITYWCYGNSLSYSMRQNTKDKKNAISYD